MKSLKMIFLLCAGVTLVIPFPGIAQNTTQFVQGNSLRNNQLGHYYKMVGWDDSPYKEFSYHQRNSSGNVVEFMNWRAVFPPGYQQNGSVKYPLIIMLHGQGESGRVATEFFGEYAVSDPEYDNNGHHLKHGGLEHMYAVQRPSTDARSFPGIVIFPQVNYNGAWSGAWDNGAMSANNRIAATIVEYMIRNYNVDQYKIAVHGLSSGARGVWDFAAKRPDLIACYLPMSGVGSDIDAMTDILVTTPLWMFQGGKDTNPSPGYASTWINALTSKGATPRYTVYPDIGHGVWTTAYTEPDFFSWMLAQDKRNIHVFGGSTDLDANHSIRLGFSAGFTDYQWMLDGIPIIGANARFYNATLGGIYTVKFRRRTDGVIDQSFPVQLHQTIPNPVGGILFSYYEFGNTLPGLSTFDFNQQPVNSGTATNFNTTSRRRDNRFVFLFEGYILIDKAGQHTFYTRSDDGSMLYINGTLVVNNDGRHPMRTRSGTVSFSSPGRYPIRVEYYDQSGEEGLIVKYNSGLSNNFDYATVIPDNKLFTGGNSSSGFNTTQVALVNNPLGKTRDDMDNNVAEIPVAQVSIYPIPFQDEINIRFAQKRGMQPVTLYNLTGGQAVRAAMVNSDEGVATLNFSDIPAGTYVLEVANSRFRIAKKH